jgi:hypothetical protein
VAATCDDLEALIPTDNAAFSYQTRDLKSVGRAARGRFFAPFLGTELPGLLSTFLDTFRLNLSLPGQEAPFFMARMRHQIDRE